MKYSYERKIWINDCIFLVVAFMMFNALLFYLFRHMNEKERTRIEAVVQEMVIKEALK